MKPATTIARTCGSPRLASLCSAAALIALFCVTSTALVRGAGDDQGALHAVVVSSDITEEGKQVAHPSKEKPIYYIPRVIGLQVIGSPEVGEPPVKPEFILHEAAKALAHEGYLVATGTRPPTLILLFQWGYIKPSRTDEGAIITDVEGKQMTGLIAGGKAGDLYPNFDHDIIDATYEDRYFILVAAYDWKEYQEHRQKKLIWVTKMSAPMTKTSLEDLAPMLIARGSAYFGRDSGRPRVEITPEAKKGTVEAGPLKTIELGGSDLKNSGEQKK